MAAVTAVTVQNTEGVLYVKGIPADVVYRQVKASLGVGVAAVKIGMLWSEETVRGVVRAIKSSGVKKVVLDTVLKASDGTPLISDEGLRIMKEELFPLSLVVTPNVPEAEELCGRRIRDLGDMEECARRILTMGPDAVVIKGGHLEGDRVVDLLCRGEGEVHYFDSERLRIPCVRGTGCTFSSAVAAFLARGFELAESVKRAGGKGVLYGSILIPLLIVFPPDPSQGVWILNQLSVAVAEEVFFRGYLMQSLGNIRTSLLFSLAHLINFPTLNSLLVFFPSLLFGFAYRRSGSILAPVLLHFSANVIYSSLVKEFPELYRFLQRDLTGSQ